MLNCNPKLVYIKESKYIYSVNFYINLDAFVQIRHHLSAFSGRLDTFISRHKHWWVVFTNIGNRNRSLLQAYNDNIILYHFYQCKSCKCSALSACFLINESSRWNFLSLLFVFPCVLTNPSDICVAFFCLAQPLGLIVGRCFFPHLAQMRSFLILSFRVSEEGGCP